MTRDAQGTPVRASILALLCGVAFALLQGAPVAAGTAGVGDADSEIRRLEDQWRRAQKANDAAAFEALLSPDLTFIGTSGTLRDRAGFMASRADSKLPRAESYEYSELRVRVFGDAAVVTGREATTGAGVAFQGRFTHVWVRQGGGWRLVAVQRTGVDDAK